MQTSSPTRADFLPLDQRQRLLLRLLRSTPDRRLQRILSRLHPADIAPLFPLLKPEEKLNLIEVLFEMGLAGQTLGELDDATLHQVLDDFPDSRLAVVLGRVPADDAVDLLDHIDADRRQAVLSSLEPALAARLNYLMVFGESTAGGIMDPDVIAFLADRTVEETLEVIRGLAQGRRLFYLYVTDERGHAALLASTIPLVLRHLDLDPTLGTSTLITAASDITGFATFLGLAGLLLQSGVG